MEIVKKIIGILLIALVVALAGVVILCGVLIIFPDATIFGFSYINTTPSEETMSLESCTAIENMQTMSGENILIEVNTKGFDIEVVADEQVVQDAIGINFKNSMIGFTNSMDTEKISSYTAVYEEGKLKINVAEPTGLFLKRDTFIRLRLPKSFVDNNNISLTTTTRGGDVLLGVGSNQLLTLANVDCSCNSAKSSVDFGNVLVKNDFYIKNILGRITMDKEIQGTVHIDSTIGTYEFGKVGNLVVVGSEDSALINNPSITLDEVNNVNYEAESGRLVIKNYVCGDLIINSETVDADINVIVKSAYVDVENATINIKQIGNFTNDATSKYTSWDYTKEMYDETIETTPESRMKFILGKSELNIEKNYFRLIVETEGGKININDTYRDVTIPNAKNARVNITFSKGDMIANSDNNALIEYMNTKMNRYLETLSSSEYYSIDVKDAESTYFDIKNIRSKVNIIARTSPINLDYINVLGISNIETTEKKLIDIKAPLSDFVIHTETNKTSRSDFKIDFASINLSSFPTDSTERYFKNETDEVIREFTARINNAEYNSPNRINIKNLNGGIKVVANNL